MEIRQALTFDDVMLVPAASAVLPIETDTRTRLTREIALGIPVVGRGGPGEKAERTPTACKAEHGRLRVEVGLCRSTGRLHPVC